MYRTIQMALWADPKVKRLTVEGKLLFVYLITNQHSHVSGIYYLPRVLASLETGIKERSLDTLYHTLSGLGLLVWDGVSEIVWIKKMLARQAKGEKININVARHLATIHNLVMVKEFMAFYSERRIPYTIPHTIPHPSFPNQEQYQEQEQKQNQEQDGYAADAASPKASELFEEFWLAYPKEHRTNKVAARAKFEKAIRSTDARTIIEAVRAFADSPKGRSRFVPHPATWLNQERWNDDRAAWQRGDDPAGKPTYEADPNLFRCFGGEQ